MGIDHRHEQLNKDVRGDGGAIGLTEDNDTLLRFHAQLKNLNKH